MGLASVYPLTEKIAAIYPYIPRYRSRGGRHSFGFYCVYYH